jgi:hypothetical protein
MAVGSRLDELQRFAASRPSRRSFRGSVVRRIAPELGTDEGLVEMAAGRHSSQYTVVLVTTRRLCVGHQPGPDEPVEISALPLDSVTSVQLVANGVMRFVTKLGPLDVAGLSPGDTEAIERAIGIPPVTGRRLQRTRAMRRPLTDLEMIAALHEASVLTEHEFHTLRDRLLSRLVARTTADETS